MDHVTWYNQCNFKANIYGPLLWVGIGHSIKGHMTDIAQCTVQKAMEEKEVCKTPYFKHLIAE